MVVWAILVAGAAGLVVLFRWLLKWRDPSWDTEEKQARSFFWSTKGGGGGFGV
jgi:hypothetical protein